MIRFYLPCCRPWYAHVPPPARWKHRFDCPRHPNEDVSTEDLERAAAKTVHPAGSTLDPDYIDAHSDDDSDEPRRDDLDELAKVVRVRAAFLSRIVLMRMANEVRG